MILVEICYWKNHLAISGKSVRSSIEAHFPDMDKSTGNSMENRKPSRRWFPNTKCDPHN